MVVAQKIACLHRLAALAVMVVAVAAPERAIEMRPNYSRAVQLLSMVLQPTLQSVAAASYRMAEVVAAVAAGVAAAAGNHGAAVDIGKPSVVQKYTFAFDYGDTVNWDDDKFLDTQNCTGRSVKVLTVQRLHRHLPDMLAAVVELAVAAEMQLLGRLAVAVGVDEIVDRVHLKWHPTERPCVRHHHDDQRRQRHRPVNSDDTIHANIWPLETVLPDRRHHLWPPVQQ